MTLLYLGTFGLVFSLILFGYLKPEILFLNQTYIYTEKNRIAVSRKIAYFPFILLIGALFLCHSSFQYINMANFARWIDGGWSNDMSRYKFAFEDSIKYSLKDFIVFQAQEPLYLFLIYFFRRITSHFSFVLLAFYMFILYSTIRFLVCFVRNVSLLHVFSFFSIFYTFILTSYCLLRMGLAVSVGLYVYVHFQFFVLELVQVTPF